MVIQPKIVKNVCLTAHPSGCAAGVMQQIRWVQAQPKVPMPKRVLVIGASHGYGLASRIAATFSGDANTIGVSYEREPSKKRTATPGWYNNRVFDQEARKAGYTSISIEGDAFSRETKEKTAAAVQEHLGAVDLVIYSLASPIRVDPDTGETYLSVIKPLKEPYTSLTVDVMTDAVSTVTIDPASEHEARSTVKVMGGEDWYLWIESLLKHGVLASGAKTVAFSYVGPELTYPIYRNGTIGMAKEDLERKAALINERVGSLTGEAYVSVNKALVTRASAVIPVVPLYISLLYRVMKDKGLHEGCIEQIYRLYADRLYTPGTSVPVDSEGRIRIDDYEMREDVQETVKQLWDKAAECSLSEIGDMEGYRTEYLQLHGFAQPGIDYGRESDPTAVDY